MHKESADLFDRDWSEASSGEISSKAADILAEMTLEEKCAQMSGDQPLVVGLPAMVRRYNAVPLPSGGNTRLGVPAFKFSDGPRGVVMGSATCFPVSMARGASWDVNLEARIGDAIGKEMRAQGANFFGGVCINLLRHPAWGRAQETYGEDPFLLGEMGAALVRGVQQHGMACAKHYACNSMENARFKVDVQVDERTLREVYLPHFKRCVDEGVASIMSAYNQVNGDYCGQNPHLLRDILKGEWGFEGFVISDFIMGVYDAEKGVAGGLDVEMPFPFRMRPRKLARLVRQGRIDEAVIDEAVQRILIQKLRFASIWQAGDYPEELVACPAHVDLALEAARKSIVLLKNDDGLLPIDKTEVKTLAVVGRLCDTPNLGDKGSSQVRPPFVVTPLAGLAACAETAGMALLSESSGSPEKSAALARDADLVVVIAGYTHEDEGEFMNMPFNAVGGDRESLTLPEEDLALIRAVAGETDHLVVVMEGGSAIITESWRESAEAILMAWYPGMMGGQALAEILFGAVNPSAKLPVSFPKDESQLPFFDKDAAKIRYEALHGYWLMDQHHETPAFPFGFGLSYTHFAYRDLVLEADRLLPKGTLDITVTLENTGPLAGEEVVQLYAGYVNPKLPRPPKKLSGFKRVSLEPGEAAQVRLTLNADQLRYCDAASGTWRLEAGEVDVFVGGSSRSEDLLHQRITVHGAAEG